MWKSLQNLTARGKSGKTKCILQYYKWYKNCWSDELLNAQLICIMRCRKCPWKISTETLLNYFPTGVNQQETVSFFSCSFLPGSVDQLSRHFLEVLFFGTMRDPERPIFDKRQVIKLFYFYLWLASSFKPTGAHNIENIYIKLLSENGL